MHLSDQENNCRNGCYARVINMWCYHANKLRRSIILSGVKSFHMLRKKLLAWDWRIKMHTFQDGNYLPLDPHPIEICNHKWRQHLGTGNVLQTTWRKVEDEKKQGNNIDAEERKQVCQLQYMADLIYYSKVLNIYRALPFCLIISSYMDHIFTPPEIIPPIDIPIIVEQNNCKIFWKKLNTERLVWVLLNLTYKMEVS